MRLVILKFGIDIPYEAVRLTKTFFYDHKNEKRHCLRAIFLGIPEYTISTIEATDYITNETATHYQDYPINYKVKYEKNMNSGFNILSAPSDMEDREARNYVMDIWRKILAAYEQDAKVFYLDDF